MPSSLHGGEATSPDILFMGHSRTSRSPTPDYSWMFEEEPAPVFDTTSVSPDLTLDDFKEESTLKRSTSPSWQRESLNRHCSSYTSSSRQNFKSPLREKYFGKASSKLTSSSRISRSPANKMMESCSASTSKPRSRSSSPDLSFIDFKRSNSPSRQRQSVNRDFRDSASTSRMRSRSPPDFSSDKVSKKPALSSWKSRSSVNKPSCSASTSKQRSRSSSPDLSFLNFEEAAASKRSTSWLRLSPQRKGGNLASSSKPRSRSPSPTYSSDKASKKTTLSWRSRSPASKQNLSCSATTSKPRSRSPSPYLSFLDFKKEPTSKRSSSASWGRLSLKRKCSSSAATSRPRSRSSSPEYAFENPSKIPTSSFWRSRSPFSKTKPSCSASNSQPRSRSSSPEYSFLDEYSTTRRRQSSQSFDPDYVPESKKVEPPKEPKAPPKKRGRPSKNKEAKTEKTVGHICPICKEAEGGPWVNTPCGHIFHKECLCNWAKTPGQILRSLKVCPSCGVDYDPDKVNPIFL